MNIRKKLGINNKSRVLEAVYETAEDLYNLGFINKRKMQKLAGLCLSRIRAIRK